jgi:hypothetical protein
MVRAFAAAAVLLLAAAAVYSQAAVPVLSVWCRTEPTREDLQALPALGFSAVTRPASKPAASTAVVSELAAAAGLSVILRETTTPLTPRTPSEFGADVDIQPGRVPAITLSALIWRGIAHGARVVSFDPGNDVPLRDLARRHPGWLDAVAAVARQLQANGALIGATRAGPPLRVDPPTRDLDVVLLDAGRTWMVVATSTSPRRLHAVVRLPAEVPYAMWLNLLDGTSLAMLEQADGPAWTLDLAPGGVAIYIIDKRLR